MGALIILSLLGLYVFIVVKSFYTKSLEITSMTYFKVANFNAKVILVLSLAILAAVLIIHGGVYWGFSLFSTLFSFLGFLTHVPMDERIETYIEQVALIMVIILFPYAKYSFSVVRKFKILLFDYLIEKYNVNIQILKDKSFPAISNFVFVDNHFLHQVKENLTSSHLRYSSQNNIDDTFYFPDKDIYVSECTIDIIEETYKVDSKGNGKWKNTKQESIFNGLVLILPKEKYNPNSTIMEPTFFKITNSSSPLSTHQDRSTKKHNIILELFYTYAFRKNHRIHYNSDNFSTHLFDHFNTTFQNYAQENKNIDEIAQKMNVDYIMEDEANIYLFHNEKNIDLFTFYQNENIDSSLITFENDFKLLLEISQEFESTDSKIS